MAGGEEVPLLLLARLMRLSRAFTPLLLVLAAPSARALSVSALRLARLLGPLLTPEPAAESAARREPTDCAGPGLESVTSLAILMADTCTAASSNHSIVTTALHTELHCSYEGVSRNAQMMLAGLQGSAGLLAMASSMTMPCSMLHVGLRCCNSEGAGMCIMCMRSPQAVDHSSHHPVQGALGQI